MHLQARFENGGAKIIESPREEGGGNRSLMLERPEHLPAGNIPDVDRAVGRSGQQSTAVHGYRQGGHVRLVRLEDGALLARAHRDMVLDPAWRLVQVTLEYLAGRAAHEEFALADVHGDRCERRVEHQGDQEGSAAELVDIRGAIQRDRVQSRAGTAVAEVQIPDRQAVVGEGVNGRAALVVQRAVERPYEHQAVLAGAGE